MKTWIVAFVLTLLAGTARSSSIEEIFRDGVLGVPWGLTLDGVVGMYPNGDHVFATAPGCRGFWVKDGQTLLSVPRPRSGVLYAFDENNKMVAAAVAFEFERQIELRAVLTGMFGPPTKDIKGKSHLYAWTAESGMKVGVKEFGEGQQKIIWLAIFAPGYQPNTEGCT